MYMLMSMFILDKFQYKICYSKIKTVNSAKMPNNGFQYKICYSKIE